MLWIVILYARKSAVWRPNDQRGYKYILAPLSLTAKMQKVTNYKWITGFLVIDNNDNQLG